MLAFMFFLAQPIWSLAKTAAGVLLIMVCIVVVLDYLGQDIKISAQVISSHVLHNHALYCSIKLLHLPIAAELIWEAGNMLDMEVVKQLHASIGELATVVTLEYLWGMLLEEWSKYF